MRSGSTRPGDSQEVFHRIQGVIEFMATHDHDATNGSASNRSGPIGRN
jgi:hypothetical protein